MIVIDVDSQCDIDYDCNPFILSVTSSKVASSGKGIVHRIGIIPVVVNTGAFLAYQYFPKKRHLRYSESAIIIVLF